MARRVYVAPGLLKVSFPGFDAATAATGQLIFSSEMNGLAGSGSGEVYLGAGAPQSPASRSVLLPAGSGLPVVWIWDTRPDLYPTALSFVNSLLIYYDAAEANLYFENRSAFEAYIGYLIYRNRT